MMRRCKYCLEPVVWKSGEGYRHVEERSPGLGPMQLALVELDVTPVRERAIIGFYDDCPLAYTNLFKEETYAASRF